jgi:hypothetical protein
LSASCFDSLVPNPIGLKSFFAIAMLVFLEYLMRKINSYVSLML